MKIRYGQQKYGDSIYQTLWTDPIYNRSESDIENRTEIAFCNVVDMQRLDDNCNQLSRLFGLDIRSHAFWKTADFPTEAEFARVLRNIDYLRLPFPQTSTTPETPDNPLNAWQKWNDAEKILYDLYMLYQANKIDFSYAGEIYSGDTIGVI